MMIALTGTPGTGKSKVASLLAAERNYRIIDVNQVSRETGCIIEHDEERDTDVVDLDALGDVIGETIDKAGFVILEGHLSHLLDVELVVVLRCHPVELTSRLKKKGFSPTKTRENVEAETVDVVLLEAVDIHGEDAVFEVDTTALEPANTVNDIMRIIEDKRDARGTHRPGGVDWLAEGGNWL